MSAVDQIYAEKEAGGHQDVDTLNVSHLIMNALRKRGGHYMTGFHGPDHLGKLVHDLNFKFGDQPIQVTVKPIEEHVQRADT